MADNIKDFVIPIVLTRVGELKFLCIVCAYRVKQLSHLFNQCVGYIQFLFYSTDKTIYSSLTKNKKTLLQSLSIYEAPVHLTIR